MGKRWIKAKPQLVDGIRFDSGKEAQRYKHLKLLERAGQITELQIHPRYPLKVGDEWIKIRSEGYPNGRKCHYTADFEYRNASGERVIEDVKGWATPDSRFRIGVFEALHGVRVEIV